MAIISSIPFDLPSIYYNTTLALDVKPGSRNIVTYNSARSRYGHKGIHIYSSTPVDNCIKLNVTGVRF